MGDYKLPIPSDNIETMQHTIDKLTAERDELNRKVEEAFDVAHASPELNMGNYDDTEVFNLNNAMIEIHQILSPNAASGEGGPV